MSVSFDLGGENYDDVWLEHVSFAPKTGEGARWMIEAPALMRILRAAERAKIKNSARPPGPGRIQRV
jgi:hypothetical protein